MPKPPSLAPIALAALSIALAQPAFGSGVLDEATAALTDGRFTGNLRYRYEFVDQDGFEENAHASTARLRAGYETGEVRGFSGKVELEWVQRLGPEHYNDTTNGRTRFPVVADPDDFGVNQAFLAWEPARRTRISGGRERIVIDDQRFIGDLAFRQNLQTYDSASIVSSAIDKWRLRYHYIFGINRIFGNDSAIGNTTSDVHALNANRRGLDLGPFGRAAVGGYAYLIDLDDQAANATQTYGLRLTGARDIGDESSLSWHAEIAHQRDWRDNATDTDLSYAIVKPSLFVGDLGVTLSYERLEGDGTRAFQTPLATLHKFQGWADLFLTTPADGIEQVSLQVGYLADVLPAPYGPIELQAFLFDFDAERGGADYGQEIDLEASTVLPLFRPIRIALRFADYRADDFGRDTTKLWLMAGMKF